MDDRARGDARPDEAHSKVRRWLTYLTLFASACALIGDVTTLVYNALGGELTIVRAEGVTVDRLRHAAYFRDLRQDEVESAR